MEPSSGSLSDIGSGRMHRVRTLHLLRRAGGGRGRPSFGFSVRGGKEHGTGFFVSSVEPGSEAHSQGLRTGDQIVRINGFPLDDAVHHEVLQLVQAQNHLNLKVRTVGMLPVKEKSSDPLTWCIVGNKDLSSLHNGSRTVLSPSNVLCNIVNGKDMPRDVRLVLTVAPHTKLGCGICKGPEWRPGIFVQFTKEGGIAREAGVRPGDQIVECNGISFADITFSDAVNLLKSSRQLDLLVSKGAGLELFPGESSGYNSSASSANGDQSPSWEDTKRLSVVKEETAELEDRLGHLESLDKKKEWDRIEYEWERAEKAAATKAPSSANSCTIIRVGENGHLEDLTREINGGDTIRGRPDPPRPPSGPKLAEICMISQQQETTTVVVEVHRSEAPEENKTPPSPETAPPRLDKSSSGSSCNSLSSAISQELQRRLQRRENEGPQEASQKKFPLKAIDDEKRQQHELLMEEFKRAHRRMFKHSTATVETQETNEETAPVMEDEQSSREERENVRGKRTQKESRPLSAVMERVIRIDREREGTKPTPKSNGNMPPPPPPPPGDGLDNISWSSKPSTEKTSSTSSLSSGKSSPFGQPPCPTPDYDTTSLASSASALSISKSNLRTNPSSTTVKTVHIVNNKPIVRSTTQVPINSSQDVPDASQPNRKVADSVEMESLESFKLNNPSGPQPKPPSTYFVPQMKTRLANGPGSSATLERSNISSLPRKPRPVSVTIGAYPSGVERRAPTRFDFLAASAAENGHPTGGDKSPITCQLHSELSQTLSRSNLRKRTEAQENLLNSSSTATSANGTVTISISSEPPVGKAAKPPKDPLSHAQYSNLFSCSHQANNRESLFHSNDKNNILPTAKPTIRSMAEKLGNTLGSNRVTIRVHNPEAESARTELQ